MNIFSKIKKIILPKDARRAYVLFCFILVGTGLEMLGVGLVLPVTAMLLSPDALKNQEWFLSLTVSLGSPDDTSLAVYALSVIILVYALKSIFMIVLAFYQYRFVYRLAATVSQRLFSLYLKVPYIFHLQNNSSILLRNMTTESTGFQNSLEGFMILATECTVLFGVLCVVFLINPVGALIAGLIVLCVISSIYFLTRQKILTLGSKRLFHDGMRNQYIMQGIGAVKELKLMHRENGFLDQYKNHNFGLSSVLAMQNFVQAAPRFFTEFLLMIIIMGTALTLTKQGMTPIEILPVLGVFGAAAVRVLPSINRILSAKQKLRFASVSVNTLYNELLMQDSLENDIAPLMPMVFSDKIDFASVSYEYPFTSTSILSEINFQIKCGESIGIIGGSGAGKSTLVDILLGIVDPSKGEVNVDGKNINLAMTSWQRQLGYVPQSVALTDDTVRRNVALGISDENINDEAVIIALKLAQLFDHISSLPQGMNTVVGERGIRISGGQRQRLGIARALYHSPSVLVLDEATSALDNTTEDEVMESVKAMQGNKTVIIIAHRTSTIEHCDRIFRIEGGKMVEIVSGHDFKDIGQIP